MLNYTYSDKFIRDVKSRIYNLPMNLHLHEELSESFSQWVSNYKD